MWPWEHAIMGYFVYSLFSHLVYRESPGGLEAFAVVFASVLPDLIDKPLSWQFGVFESGYALGHSIFFAVPLSIAVGAYARSVDRPRTGLAFAMGYLLHLPADVLDSYVRGRRVQFELMLWPVETVNVDHHTHDPAFLEQVSLLFVQYRAELLAGELSRYLWFQLLIAVGAVGLWLYDGAPVLRECLEFLSGLLEPSEE